MPPWSTLGASHRVRRSPFPTLIAPPRTWITPCPTLGSSFRLRIAPLPSLGALCCTRIAPLATLSAPRLDQLASLFTVTNEDAHACLATRNESNYAPSCFGLSMLSSQLFLWKSGCFGGNPLARFCSRFTGLAANKAPWSATANRIVASASVPCSRRPIPPTGNEPPACILLARRGDLFALRPVAASCATAFA